MLLVNTLCLAFCPFFRFLPYFLSFFCFFRLFWFRHCERSEAIQPYCHCGDSHARAPRGLRMTGRDSRHCDRAFRHCERSEAIQPYCHSEAHNDRKTTNRSNCHSERNEVKRRNLFLIRTPYRGILTPARSAGSE